MQVFTKPLADGGAAVAFLNRGCAAADVEVALTELGRTSDAVQWRDV